MDGPAGRVVSNLFSPVLSPVLKFFGTAGMVIFELQNFLLPTNPCVCGQQMRVMKRTNQRMIVLQEIQQQEAQQQQAQQMRSV